MNLQAFKSYCLSEEERLDVLYTSFMEELQGDITYFENSSTRQSLTEASKEGEPDNDTMGKLHEILFAAHAHGGVDEKGNIKRFPEDTRAAGKKSKDIYNALVKKIGGPNSEHYKKVNAAAKATAHEWVRNHVPKGHTVDTAHWSSQAGDHERITGIKDKESKADVIITSKDKNGNVQHHPISLKYTKSDPNLANNGLERISSEAGLSQGKGLADHWKDHMERTAQHHDASSGEERSSQYKVDAVAHEALTKGKDAREAVQKSHDALVKKQKAEGGLNAKYSKRLEMHKKWLQGHDSSADKDAYIKAASERTQAADKSKSEALQKIASETANSYNIKGDGHIRGSLIKLSTPHTVLPHSIAVSYTKDDGSSTPFTTHEHSFAKDHLHQFDHLTATHQGNGVVFYGKHKQTGKTTRVGTLNFKGGNGPYEGANSTLVLHNIMRDTMERKGYDYKKARSQDLSRKANSGDKEATTELQKRKASQQ